MSAEEDLQKQADAPKRPTTTEVEIERVRGGFIVTYWRDEFVGMQMTPQAYQSVASDFNGAVKLAAELLGVER